MTDPHFVFHFPPMRGCAELVLFDGIPQGAYALGKKHFLISQPLHCMDCNGTMIIFRGFYKNNYIFTCCNWRCYSLYSCITR